MKAKLLTLTRSVWFVGGIGIILGALVILSIRFITYHPEEEIHYHANFAVFVNGQREQFKGMQFYEETAAATCSLEHVESPMERAHMHGDINDVVHVEDHLVTWGNFFQNLGWGLGNDYLKTTDSIYIVDDQNKLTFMLNGKVVTDAANLIIKDEDRLLVSYGNNSDSELKKQSDSILDTAHKYDIESDPASCSGSHKPSTNSDKLKHLF